MELKIGDKKLSLYNSVAVSLQYDSVGSAFSFEFYFDPENAEHRQMFRPGSYAPVTITHEGEFLITGILLSQSFADGPVRQLMRLSGYSTPGVLEDCEIPTSAYPLQCNDLNLEQITRRIASPFGLQVVVDQAVDGQASAAYMVSTASDEQSAKSYLAELAAQRHVILSHDERGRLLLTEARTDAAPVFHFDGSRPAIGMTLDFDGQGMHNTVTLIKQQTKGRKDGTHKKGNAGQAHASNPYVPVFRPRTSRQTSGEVIDTARAARNMLSEELKGVTLKIELQGWKLGGKIIRPNSIITVRNPNLYLYKTTRFFVAQADYSSDSERGETATLTCYLPEVYSHATPKNIFA